MLKDIKKSYLIKGTLIGSRGLKSPDLTANGNSSFLNKGSSAVFISKEDHAKTIGSVISYPCANTNMTRKDVRVVANSFLRLTVKKGEC